MRGPGTFPGCSAGIPSGFCRSIFLFDCLLLLIAGKGIGPGIGRVLRKLRATVYSIDTGIVIAFLVQFVVSTVRKEVRCTMISRRLPAMTPSTLDRFNS